MIFEIVTRNNRLANRTIIETEVKGNRYKNTTRLLYVDIVERKDIPLLTIKIRNITTYEIQLRGESKIDLIKYILDRLKKDVKQNDRIGVDINNFMLAMEIILVNYL
ncbi:MAG: hypothetical protein ACRCX2_04615 [Paraclostridium sp.]